MSRRRPQAGRRRVAAVLAAATVVAGPLVSGLLLSPAAAAPATGRAPRSAAADTGAWRQVGEEDFNGSSLGPFAAYSGTPGCCHGTLWEQGQTTVVNGALRLRTSRNAAGTWVSGGAGGWGWPAGTREYGKWEARVRFDSGSGVWAALLLWPANDSWPPEVDFYEVFPTDPQRTTLVATSHYGSTNRIVSSSEPGDFTAWHTVAVEWTANRLAYLLDGKVWSEVDNPAAIPHQPMWLGIQTTLGTCPQSCPSAATPATVDLNVDWVKVYAPAGGSTATPAPSAAASQSRPTGPAVVRPTGPPGTAATRPSSTAASTEPTASGTPSATATGHRGNGGRTLGWVVAAVVVLGAGASALAVVRRRRRHPH